MIDEWGHVIDQWSHVILYGGPFVSKLISGIGDKYVKKYRPNKNIGSVSGRIGMVF